MYQIKCDDYILYDPRHDKLKVNSPKCKLEVNKVGEASFTIYSNHPYYDRLQKMRSVFEILQDGEPVFRGRMTEDTKDFDNCKEVDLEGVGAFFNDSVVRPFMFPEDFESKSDYIAATESGNVVEYFLKWLIDNHNAQVEDFQQFKLGNVTVKDSTNYISRSASDYANTWETIKSKLFDSALGGYFCIRYEADGNYIDYLEDFELTNIQRVKYGYNLLDLETKSAATESYSAVLPLGMKLKEIDEANESDARLTLSDLADGDVNSDVYKEGDLLISRSAKEAYGVKIAPTKDTTWDDVSIATNLQEKAVEYLSGTASKLSNTITITAVDLHFSDAEIEAFRIYRYIQFNSKPHGHEGRFKLTKLDIDILNPQNTKITLGETSRSMTDINAGIKNAVAESVKGEKNIIYNEVKQITKEMQTAIVADCEQIIMSSLENYVETGNFSELRETISSQMVFMAEQMALSFTETNSRIEQVDSDLQEKFNTITKYFTFDINGLTIGQVDNPNKVVIDNDEISILVNGVVVQQFDAEGRALIPELTVTKGINLFGYVIDQDSEGRVNCEYMGG